MDKIDINRTDKEKKHYQWTSGKNRALHWLSKQYNYNSAHEYTPVEVIETFNNIEHLFYPNMDDTDKQILTLFVTQNTRIVDISEMLDMPWSTVKHRLNKMLRYFEENVYGY